MSRCNLLKLFRSGQNQLAICATKTVVEDRAHGMFLYKSMALFCLKNILQVNEEPHRYNYMTWPDQTTHYKPNHRLKIQQKSHHSQCKASTGQIRGEVWHMGDHVNPLSTVRYKNFTHELFNSKIIQWNIIMWQFVFVSNWINTLLSELSRRLLHNNKILRVIMSPSNRIE